jgi:hypothetical protein
VISEPIQGSLACTIILIILHMNIGGGGSSGTGGGLLRLILLLRSYASLEAGRVGVCCVCVGFHRTPQQPLASLN